MFVAWRDLRFARGRFVLIGAVVALITLLVGFLSGLTAGLADQNISAITAISADRVVFSSSVGIDGAAGAPASYAESSVTSTDEATWRARSGVQAISPLGISQVKVFAGDRQASVAVFGADGEFGGRPALANGHTTLPQTAATALGVRGGGTVTLAGSNYVVDSVTADTWYSHTAVVWMTLHDWRSVAGAMGNADAYATVLIVTASGTDFAAADAAAGTTSSSVLGSLTALSAFRSEIGSLLLMVAMLFGISALVVGAFFTVWGMQRQPDVAILKALGASTRMLIGDALGQAAVVLVAGVGLGIGLTALFGALLGGALPFILSPLTTVLPASAMIILGLAGAAFALRSVTHADPLTALGSNR